MKKGIKAIINYTEYYNKSVDDEAAIQTKEQKWLIQTTFINSPVVTHGYVY